MKNSYTLVNPSITIKVGFKWVYISWTVFLMLHIFVKIIISKHIVA